MIKIVFQNGDMYTYAKDKYTDYKYDGKYFIVIRLEKWIGLFNLSCIEYIVIED